MNKQKETKERLEYREIDIPNLIRFIRKKEGLTQKEFGKLFGFAESATSMWENGKREAPYKVLEFVFSRWIDELLSPLSERVFTKEELRLLDAYLSLALPEYNDFDKETKMHRDMDKLHKILEKISKLLKEEENEKN